MDAEAGLSRLDTAISVRSDPKKNVKDTGAAAGPIAEYNVRERQFTLLVEGIIDYAIYMIDLGGIITSWNAGAHRIKGYTADEIIGQTFGLFYIDEDQRMGKPAETLEIAARTGKFQDEGWRVRKDGSRFWASVVVDPIYNENKELIGFAKITRDLTDKKNTELLIGKTRETLFQAQKMEAVGQLTGALAHDFNNLLAGISGSLELMQVRLAQGRILDLQRYIAIAQESSRRAAALTQRLLAFARRQTLDPKVVSVNALAAGMENLLRRTAGPAVTVEMVLATGLWMTAVDANQLESALVNLCINACDAMPGGGHLTIETANKWLDVCAAGALGLPPGQYVAVSVSDNGVGMIPDIVERAFDPFFTTKPTGLGTGLGLSVVHGFVQQSGGQARIYSEAGQGTTVCLYLPRYMQQRSNDRQSVEPDDGLNRPQRKTVMVVDDETAVLMLVSEVLDDMGYTTIQVPDSLSALKVLQSDARVDLLITDIGLPGMNGRQLADAGCVLRPDLRVLFITGYTDDAVLSHGPLKPDMHILNKPFELQLLAERITSVIA